MTFEPTPGSVPATPSSASGLGPAGLAGLGLAGIAALLLIIGSFLSWGTYEESDELFGAGMSMSLNVSGMGSAEADFDVDVNGLPEEYREGFTEGMAGQERVTDSEDLHKPGIWTIVLGVIVAAGAVLFAVARQLRIAGAAVILVAGLIALIVTGIFTADPAGALVKGDSAGLELSAGYGLWLALIGAVLAVAAGAATAASWWLGRSSGALPGAQYPQPGYPQGQPGFPPQQGFQPPQ